MLDNFDWYGWVIIPFLIFLSRICDVSLSTVRIMFVMTGRRNIAPWLGALEVLIWLIAIGQIMQHLTNVACYLAYAGGFATGTYIGMRIEERLAIGTYIVRVITERADRLIAYLKENNYRVTVLEGDSNHGKVNVLFLVIRRSRIDHVQNLIKELAPEAFYTVGSIKFATDDSPGADLMPAQRDGLLNAFLRFKKSK